MFGMDALGSAYFLNSAIAGLVEIPGFVISWYLADRIGRRWTYSVLIFVTSVALMSTAFPVLYGGTGEGIISFCQSRNEREIFRGKFATNVYEVQWSRVITDLRFNGPLVITDFFISHDFI